ncbi:MAG: hypothetical protein ACRDU5_01625 [Mycobacterium sp.]
MAAGRFGRIPGGVTSLGLHVVWCSKYRWLILGGRVAARCAELPEQIPASVGYASEAPVWRYIGHRWDAVSA